MAVIIPYSFAEANLGGHRHICAFFNSIDEEHRCFARSSKMASTGAKGYPHVDLKQREEHLKRLAEAVSMCSSDEHWAARAAALARNLLRGRPVRPGCHAGFKSKKYSKSGRSGLARAHQA